ncbi:TetR/AcrR family transcriptional regulator [Enemella sp. A6]|uniref:TetR/AcrR family transcriptional regulator n=1 Tax=Enemella sp. A6 TaxID=3440152 RepID=UPI003EBF7F5B
MDTRERILLAAERLFAEHGVDHVSLRQVGEAAGQRNNSAVQYHFGDKKGLIQGLYDLRMVPLNRSRGQLLAEMTADPSTTEIVRAYVMPLADAVVSSRGSWAYARFIDRYLGRGKAFEPFDDQHNSNSQEVMRLLSERMPDVGEDVREERRRMVVTLTTRTLADLERRLEHEKLDDAAAAFTVECLIEAMTVLVEAPSHLG